LPELTRRFAPLAFELRDGQTTAQLEGYASTFSQPYDLGLFREEVLPGAFERSLAGGADVRFLVDHEGTPLARTKSGTLQLAEDSTGLHMRADLDLANPSAVGIVSAVRRGDLDAMSFAFRVAKNGDSWNDDYSHRQLKALNIHDGDVSVVTHPANPHTSIAARSMTDAAAELVAAVTTELRSGRKLSPAVLEQLKRALDSLAADGEQATEVAAALAPTPVVDEGKPERNSGRPTDVARRLLDLHG
jgi:HK97 family phage prohead protease